MSNYKKFHSLVIDSKEAAIDLFEFVDIKKNINKLKNNSKEIDKLVKGLNRYALVYSFAFLIPELEKANESDTYGDVFRDIVFRIVFNLVNIEKEHYYFVDGNEYDN